MTFRYFGYGSLINDQTRAQESRAKNIRLKGWRREWKVTGALKGPSGVVQNVCALSVRRDPSCEILGILVEEPLENLAALDKREARYERVVLDSTELGALGKDEKTDKIFIYKASPDHSNWGSDDSPILLSYIDCVLQGVIRRFGNKALEDFFQTTDGWHVPIMDDRHAPLYQRAVSLTAKERDAVDFMLHTRNVNWK